MREESREEAREEEDVPDAPPPPPKPILVESHLNPDAKPFVIPSDDEPPKKRKGSRQRTKSDSGTQTDTRKDVSVNPRFFPLPDKRVTGSSSDTSVSVKVVGSFSQRSATFLSMICTICVTLKGLT